MSQAREITHKRIMVAALMLTVAALPFSIKICHAGLVLLLVNWMFEGGWQTKLSVLRQSLLLQIIIALFLLQSLGVAYSESFSTGWFSLEKKIFFLLVPVALATTAIRLNQNEIKLVLATFLTACFAGTLLCALYAWNQTELVHAGSLPVKSYLSTSSYYKLHQRESENWLLFSYVALSDGIRIHPTYFSLFLAFCVIFLFHELQVTKSAVAKAVSWVMIFYFSVFCIFLSSRVVLLGLLGVFTGLLIYTFLGKQKVVALILAAILSALSFLMFLNPVSRYRGIEEIHLSSFDIQERRQYTNATEIRASLWWLSLQSLKELPLLFGAGTGDVEEIMFQSSNKYNVTNVINSLDPHNQYLYTLLQNGLIALLFVTLYLTLPLYLAWAQRDFLLFGFAFLFALLCFTESALELQKGIVFYSLFSALLLFQKNSFQSVTLNVKSMIRAGR
jgi:O-antigen ligase